MKKVFVLVLISIIVSASLFADLNAWADEHLIFDNKNYVPEVNPVTEDGKSGFIILDPAYGNNNDVFSFMINTEVGSGEYTGEITTDQDDGFLSLQSGKVNAFITKDQGQIPDDIEISGFLKGILAGNYPSKQEIRELLSNNQLYDTQTVIIASLIPVNTYGAYISMSSENGDANSSGEIYVSDNYSEIPLLSYLVIDSDVKTVEVFSFEDNSSYTVHVLENTTADNSYSALEKAIKKYLGLIDEVKVIFIALPYVPETESLPSWFDFDFLEKDGRTFMCGYSNTGSYERDLKLAVRSAESILSSHIYNNYYYSSYESDNSIMHMTGDGYFKNLRLEDTYIDINGGVYVLVSISSDGYDQSDEINSTVSTATKASIFAKNAAEEAMRKMNDAIDKYFGSSSIEPEEDNIVDDWWINPPADTGDIHYEIGFAKGSNLQTSRDWAKANANSALAQYISNSIDTIVTTYVNDAGELATNNMQLLQAFESVSRQNAKAIITDVTYIYQQADDGVYVLAQYPFKAFAEQLMRTFESQFPDECKECIEACNIMRSCIEEYFGITISRENNSSDSEEKMFNALSKYFG